MTLWIAVRSACVNYDQLQSARRNSQTLDLNSSWHRREQAGAQCENAMQLTWYAGRGIDGLITDWQHGSLACWFRWTMPMHHAPGHQWARGASLRDPGNENGYLACGRRARKGGLKGKANEIWIRKGRGGAGKDRQGEMLRLCYLCLFFAPTCLSNPEKHAFEQPPQVMRNEKSHPYRAAPYS